MTRGDERLGETWRRPGILRRQIGKLDANVPQGSESFAGNVLISTDPLAKGGPTWKAERIPSQP